MLSSILVVYAPKGFESEFNGSILAIALTVFLNHYVSVHRQKTIVPILSLDVLFLFGLLVVNFSAPAMIAFGYTDFKSIQWPLSSGTFYSQYIAVALLAASGFSSGCLSVFREGKRLLGTSLFTAKSMPTAIRPIFLAIPGAILFLDFLIGAGTHYIAGSYNDVSSLEERYDIPFWLARMFLTCSVASIFVHSFEVKATFFKFQNLFIFAFYFLAVSMVAIHGDRGGLIMMSSPFLYLAYTKIPRRFWTVSIILFVMVGIVFVAALRISRNLEHRSLEGLFYSFWEASAGDSVLVAANNIGGSGILLPVAMKYVESHDLANGRLAFVSLVGAIPYSRRVLLESGVFEGSPLWSLRGADLLTRLVNGANATSGTGTTSVAEFYLDFGVVGVFLGHCLLGILTAYIMAIAGRSKNTHILVLYIYSLGVFAIMARYSVTSFLVREVGYTYLLLALSRFATAILGPVRWTDSGTQYIAGESMLGKNDSGV